jgi:Flp pilus assembly pilin Flp
MSMALELAWQLLLEDEGQDLIEYGLITGIIMTVGVLIFSTISSKMGAAYDEWGTQIQDNWEPLPPAVPTP